MTKVRDILEYLEGLAPAAMQESWDNVGLLCGSKDKEVKTIFVALDPFESVCQEAVAAGADLLVTHHPLIFQPAKSVTDDNGVGRAILTLASHGISAVNAHTNLDCTPGGVNDVLASALGLGDVTVIKPSGTDEAGNPWGLLRMGEVEEMELPTFLAQVKSALGSKCLKFVDGGKKVKKVAVGGGSCGSEMEKVIRSGCDTFITADLKYNQYWDAKEAGLNLIDAGHFYTENPVVAVLAAKIAAAFPEVEVKISKTHADCMKFF